MVGRVRLNVLKSPTAPETGVMVVNKQLAVNSGVVEVAAEPLFATIVIATTVPNSASFSTVETPVTAVKSAWKSSVTEPLFNPPTTSVQPPEAKSVTSISEDVMLSSARAIEAEMSLPASVTVLPVTTYFAISYFSYLSGWLL